MSADRLREAARLMRERAEAATKANPAPWSTGEPDPMYDSTPVIDAGRISLAYAETGHDAEMDDPTAEHIASWHPAVALAVAAWLDMQAGCLQNYGPNADSPWVRPHTQMALAVADAYLGSES